MGRRFHQGEIDKGGASEANDKKSQACEECLNGRIPIKGSQNSA